MALIRSLTTLGLKNEFLLQLHSVLVGSGIRLFGNPGRLTKLSLAEVKPAGPSSAGTGLADGDALG